jgi:ferredoxin
MFANTKPQTTVSAAEMLARAAAVRAYIHIAHCCASACPRCSSCRRRASSAAFSGVSPDGMPGLAEGGPIGVLGWSAGIRKKDIK